jgi:hypothetical protein
MKDTKGIELRKKTNRFNSYSRRDEVGKVRGEVMDIRYAKNTKGFEINIAHKIRSRCFGQSAPSKYIDSIHIPGGMRLVKCGER